MKFKLVIGGLYNYYKGGLYKTICTACHIDTGEQLVIYYDIYDKSKKYAVSKETFSETLLIKNGAVKENVQRFKLI